MKKTLTAIVTVLAFFWPLIVKQSTGKWPMPKGSLDFSGGIRLVYKIDASDATAKGLTNSGEKSQALERAKETFLFRLRDFDLSELIVRTFSDDTLVVEAPGIDQIQTVLDKIAYAQVITFRIIDTDTHALGPPGMMHEDFNYVATRADHDPTENKFTVVLSVKSREKFRDFTEKNLGKVLAICLDSTIADEARIQTVIDGDAVITGYPNREKAESIANLLKAGPLPVSFNLVEQKVISPTLGIRSFHSALVILAFGLAAIFLLLLLAYSDHPQLAVLIGICQVIQVSAIYFLAWYGYLTLNVLSVCALAILSGVSVDNLILLLEEFRRLLRMNKVFSIAAAIGQIPSVMAKEQPIIFWANLLSLALVTPLYYLEGPVRSLVTTMVIGTLITVGTTLLFSSGLLQSNWIMEGIEKARRPLAPILDLRFNLFRLNSVFLVIYAIALVAAIGLVVGKGWVRSIDFQSGAEVTLTSDVGVDNEVLERISNEYFGRRCSVRHLSSGVFQPGETLSYVVQVPGLETQLHAGEKSTPSSPTPAGLADRVQKSVGHPVQLARVESVGASVSGITNQAAIGASLVGVFILFVSLSIKYGFPITLSIIVALICDTTIAVGAICYFAVPMSLPIVSALLTVAGYSVYDSIVVAGHVNHDATHGGRYTIEKFNLSLSNLSRRLILTVATTVLAAFSIAVYCEGLLRDFAIVMVAGAVFGMMSTVAIVIQALKYHLIRPDVEFATPPPTASPVRVPGSPMIRPRLPD